MLYKYLLVSSVILKTSLYRDAVLFDKFSHNSSSIKYFSFSCFTDTASARDLFGNVSVPVYATLKGVSVIKYYILVTLATMPNETISLP